VARGNASKIRGRQTTSRPGRGAPKVAQSARSNARIGVELDGGVAHVVSVASDGTVSYSRVEQATNAVALAEVLKALGRSDGMQVALTSDNQSVRRLSIPNVPSHAVPVAMRSIAEEHMPMAAGGIAVAGLQLGTGDGASERAMTIAAVSALDAAPLLRQLGSGRPLTVSSFLLPADGLYLRVSRVTAELILVRDGAPVAVRGLRSGGVLELMGEIHDPAGTVFLGTESGNAAVDAYVEEVVGDVRRTIVFWRREGMNVPDQLTIIGEGAALASLDQRLREASYEVMPVPAPQGLNFDNVRVEDRAVAFQALAAALMDLNPQPFAALYDAVATEPDVVKKKDQLPLLAAALAGVVIVGLLGYGFYASMQAKSRVQAAETRAAVAQAQLAELAPIIKLQGDVATGTKQVNALRAADPLTATIAQKLLDAAPTGTVFKSLSLARNGTMVTGDVSATVPANNDPAFRPIAAWQDAFLSYQGATGAKAVRKDAWPGTMKRSETGATIDVTYTFSVDGQAFKPVPAATGAGK